MQSDRSLDDFLTKASVADSGEPRLLPGCVLAAYKNGT